MLCRSGPRRALTRVGFGAAGASLVTSFLTGCGTVLVTNNFAVSFDGQSGPVKVSVFDPSMGASAEWAAKTMGEALPAQPYQTSFKTTATRFVGDNSPSDSVSAGLYVPDISKAGYWALTIRPVDGQRSTVTAPFVRYWASSPSPSKGSSTTSALTVVVSARRSDLTWDLSLVVLPPANRPSPTTGAARV